MTLYWIVAIAGVVFGVGVGGLLGMLWVTYLYSKAIQRSYLRWDGDYLVPFDQADPFVSEPGIPCPEI